MDNPFLGQIQPFGFSFAPSGWAMCQGQLIGVTANSALFSLLGTTFGGDGRSTFALPDLRGRSIVGMGQGQGLTNIVWGQVGGSETASLTASNVPAHTHPATATSTLYAEGVAGNANNPQGKKLAGIVNGYITSDPTQDKSLDPSTIQTTVTVNPNTGGNQPFSVRDPYVGINYSIALAGIYPSRN